MVRGFQHVRDEVRGGAGHVTLGEPGRLNAIDHGPRRMEEAIVAALALTEADDEVGTVVLTEAGCAFSFGGDMGLEAMTAQVDHLPFRDGSNRANDRIRECSQRTIGASYGAALIPAL